MSGANWAATTKAVAVALRRSDIHPSKGHIMALGLARIDLSTGATEGTQRIWQVQPVITEAEEWWGDLPSKVPLVGFRPEMTRQWLTEHCSLFAERFDYSIDLDSAAWAVGLQRAVLPHEIEEELDLVSTTMARILRRTINF